MKENANYNLTPDVIDNVLQVVEALKAAILICTQSRNNSNVRKLRRRFRRCLEHVWTEHFLSADAHSVQNNVLTAKVVCKQTGFERDAEWRKTQQYCQM